MSMVKNSGYQQCSKCVMDTSDPLITFDDDGVCNHCSHFAAVTAQQWKPGADGEAYLHQYFEQAKRKTHKKEYDCIIGLSGGADSSYLALKVKEFGLRPLVVHIDAGWNSELAVSNIEKIVRYCDFELYTHVMDWEDMRRLQVALLRSGIPNQDMPQDHAFFANMYHFAVKNDIQLVLSGGNIATESVFPDAWHGSAMDAINLKAIYRRHGDGPLNRYRTVSFFDYYFWYPFIRRLTPFRPLDYMEYNKAAAMEELAEKTGWRPYDRKHGESVFTSFFQNYFLPERFGYDKRRPHLSSLIMSGQLSRGEAIQALAKPLYEPDELAEDKNYICKKLGISVDEMDRCMRLPPASHTDYPNWEKRYHSMKKVQRFVEWCLSRKLKIYS